MRSWTFSLRSLALLLIFAASSVSSVSSPAQIKIPPSALSGVAELEQVFNHGASLERERKWGEALSFYEDALKSYPGRPDLRERLTFARIHFDLARRYSDASFTSALESLSEREALDIYSEVLLKIHAHYVDSVNWRELVGHGTSSLDVALHEPAFLERNLPGVSPQQIDATRRELVQKMNAQTVASRYDARDAAWLAANILSARTGLSRQAAILEYACGVMGALDQYSSYLTEGQLNDVFSQIEGNFVGLGIELKADDRALLIVSVIPDGPAHRAGIRGNDRIVSVNGVSTEDCTTDEAADLLKGPEGTYVRFDVVTPSGTRREYRLQRQRVEVPSVESVRMADPQLGIGYVRLSSFQKTTSRDVDKALWQLHREGMRSLIVDVRGNPGGLLTAAVEVADKFVTSGTIVSTRGRSSREDFDYKAHTAGTWRVPLVVLIDGDSASASEIFAGAIRDHRRGTIVGQQSYGKGSVQGIFPLNVSEAGVRLTTAKFYSPEGLPISGRGISPDVVVHAVAKPNVEVTDDQPHDAVLNAGLQVARQQLSQR